MKRFFPIPMVVAVVIVAGLLMPGPQAGGERGRSVPKEALPEELRALSIRDQFLPLPGGEPAGEVQALDGHLVVLRGGTRDAYFGDKGDPLYRRDVLFTLEGSKCRVRFVTDSLMTLGPDSQVNIEELVDDRAGGSQRSVIGMLKGKAMFYMFRLLRYRNYSASVKTQTAVMGVRGTKFGVEVKEGGSHLAGGRRLLVAEAGGGRADIPLIAAAPQGGGTPVTTVYCFEGQVAVTSPLDGSVRNLGPYENLTVSLSGPGAITGTDPELAYRFLSETALGKVPRPETIFPAALPESIAESAGAYLSVAESGAEDVANQLRALEAERGSGFEFVPPAT